ncbi:enolase C-terminal domain-like protein [Salmonirosea aquatica]|uniref:Mandelate racemase n=1 Tax=Salmonirosea aquatica TaxID=2654236 RepID=A0A7C9BKF1_9BACT|nr:mandelate racemase [Cytophagaceae bacterium SJW1-29]
MSILIQKLKVSAYTVPTDGPESDGTLEWDSTTMVLVELEAGGKNGIGYTYADASVAVLINKTLRKVVEGEDALQIPAIWQKMVKAIRNNGNSGLTHMGIAAIDVALWDLKAKLLDLPLVTLLGMAKTEMLVYGSGGFTSYPTDRLQKQLGDWADAGIRYVKMKIGREPEKDVARARAAREAIGDKATLFVDANGAYSVKEAIEKAHQFDALGVTWFEEPVSSDDLAGLQFIRQHAPRAMNIAAGEYGFNLSYFERMLDAGTVDVLQADATRCGGITGFLQAATICQAHHVPFSSHCAPALHLHPAMSLPNFYIAEYFYDHVRIEKIFFDGVAEPKNGVLTPDLSRSGLGLEFKRKDAERFEI